MIKMLRDAKGHFTGKEMDPRVKRAIDKEQRKAAAILKVCETFGLTPETFGLKKFQETGLWSVGYQAEAMLEGMGFGIAFALKKGMPRDEAVAALVPVCEAMGILGALAALQQKAEAAA